MAITYYIRKYDDATKKRSTSVQILSKERYDDEAYCQRAMDRGDWIGRAEKIGDKVYLFNDAVSLGPTGKDRASKKFSGDLLADILALDEAQAKEFE